MRSRKLGPGQRHRGRARARPTGARRRLVKTHSPRLSEEFLHNPYAFTGFPAVLSRFKRLG